MQTVNSKFCRGSAWFAAVALMLCVMPFAAGQAIPEDVSGLLAELTPDHVVHVNSLISAICGRPAAADLLGFDLSIDGARMTGPQITYQEGSTLTFDLYWIPREPPASGLSAVVRLVGSGPKLEQAYALETDGWETGVVSRQRVEFRHPRGRYAGRAVLSISLRSGDTGEPECVLYTAPALVQSVVYPSKVDEARLREQFGDDVVPLKAAFRLGDGGTATVSLPENLSDKEFRGILLVSSTGYDGSPVGGETVCEVQTTGGCGFDGEIVTGTTTGPNELARYVDLGGEALKIKPFSTQDKWLDYGSVLEFDKPCRLEAITFTYVKTRGTIDMKEIGLLKAHE